MRFYLLLLGGFGIGWAFGLGLCMNGVEGLTQKSIIFVCRVEFEGELEIFK